MNRKTLIITVALLAVAGIWFFFFRSSPAEDGISTTNIGFVSSNPDVQRIEQELADLRRLKDLQIDTNILKNPFLQSLEPVRTPPSSGFQNNGTTTPSYRTPGRPNPFLPF